MAVIKIGNKYKYIGKLYLNNISIYPYECTKIRLDHRDRTYCRLKRDDGYVTEHSLRYTERYFKLFKTTKYKVTHWK